MEEFKPYPTQPTAALAGQEPAQLMVSSSHALSPSGQSPPPPPSSQPGARPDHSSFGPVKAVQYGAVERVKELVERGLDVQEPDRENVTLLHWAAINNRLEIARSVPWPAGGQLPSKHIWML